MRTIAVLFMAALSSLYGHAALSQGALLLVSREGEHALARAEGGQLRTLLPLGDKLTYGESASALAILSQKRANGGYQLDIVNKVTGELVRSWPIEGYAAGALSGASRDVVLTRTHAFFATVRYAADRRSIEPNEKGGSFDLNALSLADGSVRRVALPRNCLAPRLVDFGGTPLVYSWNGTDVWKLDQRKMQLQEVVSRNDVEDSVNVGAGVVPVRAGAFADYVMVPSRGIFRLSRFGELRQVADAKLAISAGPQVAMTEATQGSVLELFSVQRLGKPAIAVLRKSVDEQVWLTYLDPISMRVISDVALGDSVVPSTLVPMENGSILYIDRNASAVVKTSEAGTQVVWALGDADLDQTRILTVRGPIS
jgi:hypothetical protein